MATSDDEKPAKNKGGRPVGAVSKIANEAREKAKELGDLPHEFLLRIMRGEVIKRRVVNKDTGEITEVIEDYDFEARKDAAKAAAPYFAPKISTVEVIHGVSDADLDEFITRAAAEAGISFGTGGEVEEGADSSRTAGRPRIQLH